MVFYGYQIYITNLGMITAAPNGEIRQCKGLIAKHSLLTFGTIINQKNILP